MISFKPYLCAVKFNVFFVGLMLSVLLTSFVGQHFRVYSYVFDNFNFTEKYCVNKDKPESKCKGACQMKKLASEEKENSDSTPSTTKFQVLDLFLCVDHDFVFVAFFVQSILHNFNFLEALNSLSAKILAPPPKMEFV